MSRDEMLRKITALQSDRGGWTRASLSSLGVPFPPPRGWKKTLLKECVESNKINTGGEINSIVEWDKRESEEEEHDYFNAT